MEGTLGAAERALLRGRVCEAALLRSRRKSGPRPRPCESATRRRVRKAAWHSSHEGREHATRGVRADRVGAKPLRRAIASGGAGRLTPKNAGPWPVKPRSRAFARRLAGLGGTPAVRSVIEAESSVGSWVVLANCFDCRSR
jgi:hypothetical protein